MPCVEAKPEKPFSDCGALRGGPESTPCRHRWSKPSRLRPALSFTKGHRPRSGPKSVFRPRLCARLVTRRPFRKTGPICVLSATTKPTRNFALLSTPVTWWVMFKPLRDLYGRTTHSPRYNLPFQHNRKSCSSYFS